jgi:hypothetical protein
LKQELALLKRLEEDCQSIQRSLAIIQSAQHILTYYTAEERRRLFKEYETLTSHRTAADSGKNPHSPLAIFRQDHPDIAVIADVLAQGLPVDLSNIKLNVQKSAE